LTSVELEAPDVRAKLIGNLVEFIAATKRSPTARSTTCGMRRILAALKAIRGAGTQLRIAYDGGATELAV